MHRERIGAQLEFIFDFSFDRWLRSRCRKHSGCYKDCNWMSIEMGKITQHPSLCLPFRVESGFERVECFQNKCDFLIDKQT